jgi:dipeptidyl aminopeptidase/acylaminoacyl peptidase
MSARETPCGAWPSPIDASLAAGAARRLSQPQQDGEFVAWLEGRPDEAGRQTVVRARADGRGGVEELTPGRNVRSRVHEYGGGDYRLAGARVFAADAEGGVLVFTGGAARPLESALPGAHYGDFAPSPDGRWLVCVEEERAEGEPANRLVALALRGRARLVVAGSHDFVSSPVFSPDGARLAYVSWEHPDLPWDATVLHVVAFGPDGPAGTPRAVAGGAKESIAQPRFAPGGALRFASDRDGWWNLYELADGAPRALCPLSAEFAGPAWVLGLSTVAHDGVGRLWAVARAGGRDALGRVDPERRRFEPLALPFDAIEGLAIEGRRAVFVGGGARRPPAVTTLDLETGALRELRAAFELALEPGFLSAPEVVEFPSEEGRRAHAFLYRPASAVACPRAGERPPLAVRSHGGPTSAASPALKPGLQYWTSRGFAVIDVDYAGSTGYGRAYRELLHGQWGVRDVADCAAAARFAVAEGVADPARLVATGGSAGGYTTLCLLTFRDEFAAGASHYGIGDLEALARDTHKFESRYLERLVGPWPERADLYRARSPAHHPERLARPLIFFQGLEDRVVPPSQTTAMAAALAARGVPHAVVEFEGEGHGFRRAQSLTTTLEGERWFYGRVLGYDVGPPPAGVMLAGDPRGQAARAEGRRA